MINQVTREESLLDLIITNCPNYFETFGVSDPINDLDHCPIHGQIRLTYPKKANYQRTIFKYTAENLSKLNNNLKDVPWNVMLSHNDTIDDMVVNFTSIVKDEMKECIPNKTVLIRPSDKPGMTGRIRKLFRKCNRLHKIASKSKLPQDIEKHRTARKEAKNEWKIAKQNYYNRLYSKMSTSENKNKVYWKITKSLYGQNKIPNIPTLTLNGTDYTDDESKATILNEYFVSQTRLTNPYNWNLTCDIADDTNSPTLNTVAINPDDIMKYLTSLNTGKACGPDGIGNNILKNCADGLAMPITILAKHSINSGTFPSSWKTSNVVPIFKKDDKSVVSNYRPISLLSCTSKIVERLVYNEL